MKNMLRARMIVGLAVVVFIVAGALTALGAQGRAGQVNGNPFDAIAAQLATLLDAVHNIEDTVTPPVQNGQVTLYSGALRTSLFNASYCSALNTGTTPVTNVSIVLLNAFNLVPLTTKNRASLEAQRGDDTGAIGGGAFAYCKITYTGPVGGVRGTFWTTDDFMTPTAVLEAR